jgi:Fe-S-cluster-containing dehydrogenase component
VRNVKRLIVEAEFCTGCAACEVACKQEHALPVGPRLIRVLRTAETEKASSGKGVVQFRPVMCHHCTKAPCIAVCPTGALFHGEGGRVTVRREDCIGCGECLQACPFGIPQFDPADGTALLCDLCPELTHLGKQPACAHHCPARVLHLADPNKVVLARQAAAG